MHLKHLYYQGAESYPSWLIETHLTVTATVYVSSTRSCI